MRAKPYNRSRMSWRLRLSVETILRPTPAMLGSTVFSIAGLCTAHACLDDQALLAAPFCLHKSSIDFGQSLCSRRERARSARSLPPVWQRAQ